MTTMNQTTSPVAYLPITAAILVLALVFAFIDLRVLAQPNTVVVQPTATPVVVVVVTPEAATVNDQLAGLRGLVANRVSASLPSFDEFRAGLDGAPVEQRAQDSNIAESLRIRQSMQFVAPIARLNPDGAPVYYDAGVTNDGRSVVLTPTGPVYCRDTGWAYSSLAPWEQNHVIEICGMIRG